MKYFATLAVYAVLIAIAVQLAIFAFALAVTHPVITITAILMGTIVIPAIREKRELGNN